MVKKVITVSPRGFCAGVDRAVRTVSECLDIFGAPVYVKHEIVHNFTVVSDLEAKGVVTVEDVSQVPEGAVVVFSAHGSPPEHYTLAKERNLRVIDATCPLVTKVHMEVRRFLKQGYSIIYIGHKNHVEGIGVRAEAKKYKINIPLVETADDARSLNLLDIYGTIPEKLVYLTQTTLSVDETAEVIETLKDRFPYIEAPPMSDICYATTNRQRAIKELSQHVDVVLVVGSQTSSNSKRLTETAQTDKVNAYLIDGPDYIKKEWFSGVEVVGISAGASAPEHVVKRVVEYFTQSGAVHEEISALKETMAFADPIELICAKEGRMDALSGS